MKRPSNSVIWLTVLLLGVSGCKKKQKAVPAAAQAPTITAPVSQQVAPPPVATAPATADKAPATPAEATKVKPKPKPKPAAKKPSPIKPTPTDARPASDTNTVAKAAPPRIVVQPGPGTSPDPSAVVPDLTHTEEAHHRQTTEQLMQSTEANLKSLKRVLSEDERALLQQVQLFMAQSREATESQDLVRAHNLALKAHLLSDELVR
ncbi:MAG TPA: hypothetical protein VMZ25_07035 [Terriglobales bacterium]|nr:hypothetical protein [Terriglobales bacterium]